MDLEEYSDPHGILPEGWMLDMIELLVHTGVEHTGTDKTFKYFKCRVPMCIMKSPWGMAYFAPNMKFNNDMAPPTPDHVRAADRAFEKAKKEPAHDGQWILTLRCNAVDEDGNVCGREETEIHNSATEGLANRYCGKCGNTKLQLVRLDPIKEGDWCFKD
jgi:hypothetical protein